jgi:hypothetical protein
MRQLGVDAALLDAIDAAHCAGWFGTGAKQGGGAAAI